MKFAIKNMLVLSAAVLVPAAAQAAANITGTTQAAFDTTFASSAFTARAAQGGSGQTYSLTDSATNGVLTNGQGLFGKGVTRAFSLTYNQVSGLTNFSIAGQNGVSVTASQLGGFSDLGFRLRADADSAGRTGHTITLGNLVLNGSALGGAPVTATGATSYFSLSSLSASDFDSGFSLAGDINMNWLTGSNPNTRIEARILGAGVLPGVPEPATWAMLILGFGMVGVTMRRAKTTTVKFVLA